MYKMTEDDSTIDVQTVLDLEASFLYDGRALPSGSDNYWDSFIIDKETRRVFIAFTHGLKIDVARIRRAMRELGMLAVNDTSASIEARKFELVILVIGNISTNTGISYQTLSNHQLSLVNWRDLELRIQPNESKRIAHRVKSYILLPETKYAYVKSSSDDKDVSFENVPIDYLRMISISRELSDSQDRALLLKQ